MRSAPGLPAPAPAVTLPFLTRGRSFVLRWFRRRRLSEGGRRRLAFALARAEEALIEAHVRNVLDVYDAIGEEASVSGVAALYLDAMEVAEPQASIIARRVLARSDSVAGPRRRARSRRGERG
jgi:hypothetical protein